MHPLDSKVVQDKGGRCGTIISAAPHPASNASQVVVQLESGHQVLVSGNALVPQPDGRYYLPLCLAELEHTDGRPHSNPEEPLVIPVIVTELEEVLVVEKRLLLKEELHIRQQRVETHQPQHITLRSEEALIERLHNTEP